MDPIESRSRSPGASAPWRRPAVIIGVAAGLLVVAILGGTKLYDIMATPAVPDINTASLDEVAKFWADPRGLVARPRFEQERILADWRTHFSDVERHRKLKTFLEQQPEEQIVAIRQVMMKIKKRQFMEDAEEYLRRQNDPSRGYDFLMERLGAGMAEIAWLKGNGDPQRDLSKILGTGLPDTPEDWRRLVMSETTPEERVIGEQYLNALRTIRDQERKKQRGAPTTTSVPSPPGRGKGEGH